jgi:hypothetical protein
MKLSGQIVTKASRRAHSTDRIDGVDSHIVATSEPSLLERSSQIRS